MDILQKVYKILFEPSKFFSGLKKEKSAGEAFKYFLILAIFGAVMGGISLYFFSGLQMDMLSKVYNADLSPDSYSPTLVANHVALNYILGIIGIFILAGLLHISILIFGGKENYTKTFQMTVYAWTPIWIFGWIPLAGLIAAIYTLFLLIIGTQKVHKIAQNKVLILYALLALLYILLLAKAVM
jgi:hypothetical protein